MKKKVNIGFDIGITSVGWAIVDEENNIIDRGVRLFKEPVEADGKPKNQKRREKRSARRMIRRKRNRKDDFIKLITKDYSNFFGIEWLGSFDETKENFLNVVIGNHTDISILDEIIKGLKEEIKPLKLVRILYYYLSHRGYSYITEDYYKIKKQKFLLINSNERMLDFANWYRKNKELEKEVELRIANIDYSFLGINDVKSFKSLIEDFNSNGFLFLKYPSEIQKDEFLKYRYFRSNEINIKFSKFHWIDEIKKIFSNQKTLLNNSQCKEFMNDYLKLFERKRKYSQGPGSEKSPTIYGLWKKDLKGKLIPKPKDIDNLWDLNVGKCSVFTNEKRASWKSCSSEISNILSQLNTIQIDDDKRETPKLTKDEKEKIIFEIIKNTSKETSVLKIIKNECHLNNIDLIAHYPYKKDEKSLKIKEDFEKLENTKLLFSIFSKYPNEFIIKDFSDFFKFKDLFNSIIEIVNKYREDIDRIEEFLVKKFEFLKNKTPLLEELFLKRNEIYSSKTSSMSLKALDKFIYEELENNGKNLNQKYKRIIEENEMKQFNFEKSKYINLNCFENKDFILSPTAKRSFKEVLKVFNKILKRYIYNPSNKTKQTYYLKNIVIEVPKSLNSEKQKKAKAKENALKKKNKDFVIKKYECPSSIDDKTVTKLVLLDSQQDKDIYTGEPIHSSSVIHNPNYCDIDHIIPWSLSFDNSLDNKVLVLKQTNSEKGNKTAWEYINSRNGSKSPNEIISLWEKCFKNSKNKNLRKLENLLFDFGSGQNKYKNLAKFIGRNLVDTRYATKKVTQILDAWVDFVNKKQELSDEKINIVPIKGKETQKYRQEKWLNIPKNREEDNTHHAIDATICAILGNNKSYVDRNIFYKYFDNEYSDKEKQNKFMTAYDSYKKNENNNKMWKDLSETVKETEVKFSYKVINKKNFEFWDEQPISVANIVEKGKNVYKKIWKIKLLDEKFYEKNFEKIMQEIEIEKYPDPKLLKDIMKAYNWGKKIRENNNEFANYNPFIVYKQEYLNVNATKDSDIKTADNSSTSDANLNVNTTKGSYIKSDFLPLEGTKKNGEKYIYYVSSFKIWKNNINRCVPIKKNQNAKKFGAYDNLNWKEIRLFRKNNGKYVLIPMSIDMYKNDIHKKVEIDIDKYEKMKQDEQISNDNFFPIFYGSLLMEKTTKILYKIVSISVRDNQLEINEIYKKRKKEEKRKYLSINTIIKDYYFCNVDVLGNISLKKDLGI